VTPRWEAKLMPMATYKVVIQGRTLEVNGDSERQAKREAVRYCVYATGGGIGDECAVLSYDGTEMARLSVALGT
jgi:hypothetical protein